MTTEKIRLQQQPAEGDRETIERELARTRKPATRKPAKAASTKAKPTEQGVDLDPKRRID